MWPCTLVGELRDAAFQWLKLETVEGCRIIEKLVLHQLYKVVLMEARVWITQHRPTKLKDATWLLENFLDVDLLAH